MAINSIFDAVIRRATLACFTALAIGHPVEAADIAIRTIALSGEPAPDGNGLYSSFQAAAAGMQLNDAGQVGFIAWLTGTSGGDADNGGIFRGDGGPVTQITRLPYFRNSHFRLNSSGEVAFTTFGDSVAPPGTENLRAVFRYDGETLIEIAREGQALSPGQTLSAPGLLLGQNDSGLVAFHASRGDFGGDLYVGNGQNVSHVVGLGQPAPDGNGIFLDAGSPVEINNIGKVFLLSLIVHSTSPFLNDQGLFIFDGASVEQVARSNQPAPDGDGVFASFPLYSDTNIFNDSGQIAFPVELVGASSGHARIYRSDGSSLTEIARTGQVLPGGATFTSFEDRTVTINNSGQVAFGANLPGNVTLFDPHHGLYIVDGNNVLEIVRTGQLAPDGSGMIVSAGGQRLNDAGHVAFMLCTSTGCGNYFFDGTEVTNVVRDGDVLDLGGGDTRTIEYVNYSSTGPELNNRGQLAFTAKFTDGTSGVFLASIFKMLPGDYNADGKVDAADYVVWRKTVGQVGTGLPADGDHNGVVDNADFGIWRAHFGQSTGHAMDVDTPAATVPEPATIVLLLIGAAYRYLAGGRKFRAAADPVGRC